MDDLLLKCPSDQGLCKALENFCSSHGLGLRARVIEGEHYFSISGFGSAEMKQTVIEKTANILGQEVVEEVTVDEGKREAVTKAA